jgi:branched-chain amino acid transport system ATP-binding protein
VFNLLTKFLLPSSGAILFRGEEITNHKPASVARRGLVRSFQISSTFPHMTVLENVRIALQRKSGSSYAFWRSERSLAAMDGRALEILGSVELAEYATLMAVDLPYGRKRALELATTLALEPDLMLLDEPTQGMAHEDVGRVVELIKKVGAGRTILMVEHNLSVVEHLCDTITVLQRGEVLTEGDYSTVSNDPRVLEAYVGVSDDD